MCHIYNMIVGNQPERDEALQKAGAPVSAVFAVRRRGNRRLDQIVARFRSEVIFQVSICYEFETPSHEMLPPVLSKAEEVSAVV
jgi:hypothetical protein